MFLQSEKNRVRREEQPNPIGNSRARLNRRKFFFFIFRAISDDEHACSDDVHAARNINSDVLRVKYTTVRPRSPDPVQRTF